jgi:putative sugar O-methyltransferase
MSVRAAIEGTLQRKWARARGRLRRTANLPADRGAIDRYRLMREDNARADDRYRAGAFWEEINSAFSDLIWSGALTDLRDQYFNNRFSAADPGSHQIYSHFIWLYYQRIEALDRFGFLKEASEPAVGGTRHQVSIHGRPVSLDFLRSVEEAYAILEAWETSGRTGAPRLFVELGAGYGRLAYVVRKLFKGSTYVILDLPEALLCSSSWLERVLPGEVQPYEASRSEARITRDRLLSMPVWTLGAQRIEALENDVADVFVNIFSFAEMPPAAIANYFAHVDRLTTGIFYTKQRKLENNVVDRVSVSEATYPVRSHWKQCFHRTTSVEPNFFEAAYATRT